MGWRRGAERNIQDGTSEIPLSGTGTGSGRCQSPSGWKSDCHCRTKRSRKDHAGKAPKRFAEASGRIYAGEDMAGKTVAMLAEEVGYVFQNPDDQIFKYHVIDEVMFGPQNIGMSKEQAKNCAMEALKTVGLEALAEENPYDLELSQRKLVAIASVLAMDTKVLILDEPTIAQDWKGRRLLQKIIRTLQKQGKMVIAILHDMDFVAECFERVIVMAHGKVLADGRKEEVFARYI